MNSKYYTFYENTIIDSIDFDGYNVSQDLDLFGKINEVYKIFVSEMVVNNNNSNELDLFEDWLRGLCLVVEVPFMNYDILNNANSAGFKLDSEVKEDNFLETYWRKLAEAFFTLKNNL